MQKSSKIIWADNIRFIATFGVIILHISGIGLYEFGNVSIIHWSIANTFDSAMRCCVPLFIMLSGALLLSKDKDLLPYLKNRFVRIVLPFLFWSIIYSLLIGLDIFNKNSTTTSAVTISDFLLYKGSFKQQAYHLWYVYMILGIFLIAPILRKWIKSATEKEILYFLIIWIITVLLDLKYFSIFKLNIQLTFFSGYLGYFVLGYYLSIKKFEEIPLIKNSITLIIISLIAFTAYGTFVLTATKGKFEDELYQYLYPNIILLSVAVFLWVKSWRFEFAFISSWRNKVNEYSFGIYLAHVAITWILNEIGFNWSFIHPLLAIPVTATICLIISFGLIHFLRLIPGGKYISG